MKRILLSGLAVLPVILVMALGSCGLDLDDDGYNANEYTDWVEGTDANGNRTLTLYFGDTDGVEKVGVPVKNGRAVGIELAHMSHDYFEAVFVAANPTTVARSTWELGQNAGIRGVYRTAEGVDYSAYGQPGAAGFSSTVFVGRKADRTLLGVGYLSHVDDIHVGPTPGAGTALVTTATRSVTFTVIPVTNRVTLENNSGTYQAPATSSFWTTKGFGPSGGPGTVTYGTASGATATSTTGRFSSLGGVDYPLFELPEVPQNTTLQTVFATYKFTYPFISIGSSGSAAATAYRQMNEAVRLINTTTDKPTIIKREARFLDSGQLMYAQTAQPDVFTKVRWLANANPVLNTLDGTAFNPDLQIQFDSEKRSNKTIFSIVFQIPVYAITRDASTNGAFGYEKWYIRPGFGVPLYNLDNGEGAGGCVLLGTGVSALDFIEIKIVGIGLNQDDGILP